MKIIQLSILLIVITISITKEKVGLQLQNTKVDTQLGYKQKSKIQTLQQQKQSYEPVVYDSQIEIDKMKGNQTQQQQVVQQQTQVVQQQVVQQQQQIVQQQQTQQQIDYEQVIMKKNVFDDMSQQVYVISHDKQKTKQQNKGNEYEKVKYEQKQKEQQNQTIDEQMKQIQIQKQKEKKEQIIQPQQQQNEEYKIMKIEKQEIKELNDNRRMNRQQIERMNMGLRIERKQQYELMQQMIRHVKDKESLTQFIFKMRHNQQFNTLYHQQQWQNIKDNYKILVQIESDIKGLREQLKTQDNSEPSLMKINEKVVGLDKTEFQIEIEQNMNELMKYDIQPEQFNEWIVKYTNMNSQLYRISHNINIRINDDPVESITKLLQSMLFNDSKIVKDSEYDSYMRIEQEQNKRINGMYMMIREQNKDQIETLEQMQQLETINQDIMDEQQTQSKVNQVVRVDIDNLIQRISKSQDYKVINDTINYKGVINDEEEDYIRSNNIHLNKQMDIQQQTDRDREYDNIISTSQQSISTFNDRQDQNVFNIQNQQSYSKQKQDIFQQARQKQIDDVILVKEVTRDIKVTDMSQRLQKNTVNDKMKQEKKEPNIINEQNKVEQSKQQIIKKDDKSIQKNKKQEQTKRLKNVQKKEQSDIKQQTVQKQMNSKINKNKKQSTIKQKVNKSIEIKNRK